VIAHQSAVKSLRVLAVDDEPMLGKIVSRLLAVDGHTVVVARSLEEAIAELAHGRFDVVLSDLGLGPGAEGAGWELAYTSLRTTRERASCSPPGGAHRSTRKWPRRAVYTRSSRNPTS
jgi:CheY-like chemotaxis protein